MNQSASGLLQQDVWHREALTVALRDMIKLRRWGMRVTVYNDPDSNNNGDWYLAYNENSTDKQDNLNWVLVSNASGQVAPAGAAGELQKNSYPDAGSFASTGLFNYDTPGDLRMDALVSDTRTIYALAGGERVTLFLDAGRIGTDNNMYYIGLLGTPDVNETGAGYLYIGDRGASAPTLDPTPGFYLWSEGGVPTFQSGTTVIPIVPNVPLTLTQNTRVDGNFSLSFGQVQQLSSFYVATTDGLGSTATMTIGGAGLLTYNAVSGGVTYSITNVAGNYEIAATQGLAHGSINFSPTDLYLEQVSGGNTASVEMINGTTVNLRGALLSLVSTADLTLQGTNGVNVNSSDLIVSDNTKAFYLGQSTVDGNWRFMQSGDDLVFQQREAGVWVTKQTISGA